MQISTNILKGYPGANPQLADSALKTARRGFNRKIIVLDDDPTGVQTVHNVSVYTDWSEKSIKMGFDEPRDMFYILTNSRSFSQQKTKCVHHEIGCAIAEVSRKTGRQYVIISRGDSTLRGHYPIETEALRAAVERQSGPVFDGEILCPFFPEGGRYTLGNIHYVRDGDLLVPAGETEFAKDASFGYRSSNLMDWCLEKYKGAINADHITAIPLDLLQAGDVGGVTDLLLGVTGFGKVIVNAVTYSDVKIFCAAYLQALKQGREFLFRTAAALPKVLGKIPDRALLTRSELISPTCVNGGIVLVGSHVQKTTRQLEILHRHMQNIHFIVFDQHKALEPDGLLLEKQRVIREAESIMQQGATVVVHTRRDRLDIPGGNADQQLEISTAISDALTGVIGELRISPRFIIAKGGITSSDVGTKALHVKRADVAGQILPGIPVWKTGDESKFPGLPFIIFPGNVGDSDALLHIVNELAN